MQRGSVLHCSPLANGYQQLTLDYPTTVPILPGHYVLVENNYALSIMGFKNNTIDIILPPELPFSDRTTLLLSDLQGTPLEKPSKEIFYLIQIEQNGLAAGIFYLKQYKKDFKGLVLIGSQKHFPFMPCPSRQMISGIPSYVIASMPLLEDWGVPNRLASVEGLPGCFEGSVDELANIWLENNFSLQNFRNSHFSNTFPIPNIIKMTAYPPLSS